MKKLLSLLLVAMMMFTCCACSNDTAPADQNAPADEAPAKVSLPAVKEDIVSTLGIEATDMNETIMINMYGFPADGIVEQACFTAPGEVFNEEIFMLKATDADNADAIEQNLTTRLDSLKKQSADYSPETAAILEKATVLRNDNYVAFFFSAQREEMEEIYKSYF